MSLAVWIGGAVEEIDKLTRATAAGYNPATTIGPPAFYDALLKMAGYERAVVDVITGASAGGLNGVVLAASRAYGFRFGSMLPVWVRLADIELLTRDPRERTDDGKPGDKERRPQSLLRGDEYFLRQLQTELTKLIASGDDAHAANDSFELILSATLENPEYVSTDEDPFAPLPEVRRSASFAFRFLGEVGDNGGDFQSQAEATSTRKDSTVSLLALAGRATSSFPVAFEPATVGPEAARIFSDAPQPGAPPCRVLDGGVLDNIPVTKAIEAIAAAPVPGAAERWLVFLHPSPSARADAHPDRRASAQAWGALLTTASAAFGQESLLDDLDELERHNAEVRRQRLRRQALLRTIAPGAYKETWLRSIHETAEKLHHDTPVVRAKLDAVRALRIISGDLRVRRPLTDGPDRAKWSEWLKTVRRQLEDEIATAGATAYAEVEKEFSDVRPRAAVLSAGGLLMASNLVGAWVRNIPVGSDDDGRSSEQLEHLAQQVSELRRIVQTALNWSDQAWLVAASTGPKVDLPWAYSAAALAAESMRRIPRTELRAVAKAFGHPVDDSGNPARRRPPPAPDLRAAVAKPLRDLDDTMRAQVMAGQSVPKEASLDLGKWVWGCLVGIVRRAAAIAPHDHADTIADWAKDPHPVQSLLDLLDDDIGRAGRVERLREMLASLDEEVDGDRRRTRLGQLVALASNDSCDDSRVSSLKRLLAPAQDADDDAYRQRLQSLLASADDVVLRDWVEQRLQALLRSVDSVDGSDGSEERLLRLFADADADIVRDWIRRRVEHLFGWQDETVKDWRRDRAYELLTLAGQQHAGQHRNDEADASFEHRLDQRADPVEQVLADLVTVLTPAQASMLESDEEVQFVRISGNNETPLKRFFVDQGQPFGVDEKLCGNELGNFAAFCSAKWRANDWMWGRLDAVKSLVDLTIRPERIRCSTMSTNEIWLTIQRISAGAGMSLDRQQIEALKLEVEVARRGVPNPDGVALVREVLTEAMQRQIFATMRPIVDKLDERPYWDEALDTGSVPTGLNVALEPLNESMHRYNVGSETIRDLDSRRRTQIGMRLALVGHSAFRPLKRGLPTRIVNAVMTLSKPFYLFGTFAALNIARAMFLLNMIAVGFWVGPWRFRGNARITSIWQLFVHDKFPGIWPSRGTRHSFFNGTASAVGFAFIFLLTMACLGLAIRNRLERRRRLRCRLKPPPGFWWYLASFVVGAGGVLANWLYGINLGPLSVALSAAVLAWFTCLWMRRRMQPFIVLGTFASYALAATAWWGYSRIFHKGWLNYTGWMSIAAMLLAQAFLATFCSYFKVLDGEQRLMLRAEQRFRRRAAAAAK